MDDFERDLESMGLGNFFDFSQQVLLRTEIEQIMMLGYDYMNADKLGDVMRRNRIFRILVGLSKRKKGMTTLQEYFGGKRIGHFRNTITDENARDWVFNAIDDARNMNDWRVKPTPHSERAEIMGESEEDEYDDVSPDAFPEGTFEMEGELAGIEMSSESYEDEEE